MRRVVLIGFMGAGKTTVGRALAEKLRCAFRDLDDMIERRDGRTIAQIFNSAGEPAFRRLESDVLRDLLQDSKGNGDLILALGGGAFVQAENRAQLEQAGSTTVWLEAPLAELERRCMAENKERPLAREQERFTRLFAARQADYALAQFRVQTENKGPHQVAAEIEELLKQRQSGGRK